MELINRIQKVLEEMNIDGWLFYDFHRMNDIALNILRIDKNIHLSRRFFYFIPQNGTPIKLVHIIEKDSLSELPGKTLPYSSWDNLKLQLSHILKDFDKIAMEYSPNGYIPTISKVDAGTIELIKDIGANIVSSGELIQLFECRWDEERYRLHKEAASFLRKTVDKTFAFIWDSINQYQKITEYDVQQYMANEFKVNGFITDCDPIVAINENSANPHYFPQKDNCRIIKKDDFVLIDLWIKKNTKKAVYGDITWTGFIGKEIPDKYKRVFDIVKEARDKAIDFIASNLENNKLVRGFEADDVCRNVINDNNMGKYFIHRTGHNIHEDGHGPGANIDNFETHDERLLIPSTCFSIEPGIYIPDHFGIRSEVDVFIHNDYKLEVTGQPIQKEIIPILK